MKETVVQINNARRLAETGQFAAMVSMLEKRPREEIARSATLALLLGMAEARLGDFESGQQWVETALNCAEATGDGPLRARALNILGAIAFERGRIDDAETYFEKALADAKRVGDTSTVGRCSNNRGIIANLRGDYAQAIGSYTMALAAFQQAGMQRGIAEAQHNLGITYRDLRNYPRALEAADRAVAEAEAVGDEALAAQALSGRAEIRVLSGDARLARREVESALTTHRKLSDLVGETEDLRILAATLAASGEPVGAARVLNDVIKLAESRGRLLLLATARRDLAFLLWDTGRSAEAKECALTARVGFSKLGALAQMHRLDELITEAC